MRNPVASLIRNRVRFFAPALIYLLVSLLIRATAAGSETQPRFTSRELAVGSSNKIGFTLVPANAAGISFTNFISEQRHLTNQILLNGCGVAAGDVDEDGWCDLYFCSSDGPNRLYRNLGGWKFQDFTDAAGVALPGVSATGAAFADVNGDRHLDLIVNSLGNGTHIFLNDGRGHFRKIAVLNHGGGGMSLAIADVDGDGFLDLYIANYRTSALMDMPNARAWFKTVNGRKIIEKINGRPLTDPDLTNRFSIDARGGIEEAGQQDRFYRNHGGTNFTDVPFTGGAFLDEDGTPLAAPLFDWGLSAMFRDLNGDGLPDLYVCNDFETPDRVWINQGGGRFRALPRVALRKSSYFSMGLDVADVNRDGWDDILVLDMLNRDHPSRITQMLPLPPLGTEIFGIQARPQYMITTLSLNRGDGTYAEIAQLAGLEASDWSWSPVFLDVDLDGWEDLLLATGHERAARDLDIASQMIQFRKSRRALSDAEIFQARRAFPRLATGTLAFRNRGDLTFEEVGSQWGFKYRGVSQGMALADLDNDGDLDVVINNSNDAPCLFRDETSAPRVAVRLRGYVPNTRGIGARITLFEGAVPVQSQEMVCAGRYLSCDDNMRVFAAGALTNDLRIEVAWRSGRQSVVEHAEANRVYEIEESVGEEGSVEESKYPSVQKSKYPNVQGTKEPKIQESKESRIQGIKYPNIQRSKESKSQKEEAGIGQTTDHGQVTTDKQHSSKPWFDDVSNLLNHTHHDDPFDDFARQPLLPNRLSQLGPGVAWFDLDGDGWEDLFIGSGKGGKLAAYLNDRHGGFKRTEEAPFNSPVTRDQTTLLGWRSGPGGVAVLAGSANYEDGLAVGGPVRSYEIGGKAVQDLGIPSSSSTGPLAMADIDGDGDLDLFVGGRCLPGRYPEAASSVLYRNTAGQFQVDLENSKVFDHLGLVSAAVFSDLTGDGQPDLVLACDWGPVRVFRNERGRFTEMTRSLGLAQYRGWWNGVSTGDFDADGRLDIVASNWGRNTKYQSHRGRPLRILFGDFNGDGAEEIIEAYYDAPLGKYVPERQLAPMARAMPFLQAVFPSHHAYAVAGVQEVLGDRASSARTWDANWLESTVFLNRGDHFEARALPVEAQMAPAFGVCVGDFDADGNEDVFLAQNFFASQPETPRYDAGRGLWLRGDGRGSFTAVPGQESGLKLYGEQRGCAVCDYDHDGRVDLVVSQNGAATKLFHNTAARPGLRVRLKGPADNPAGLGAVMRLSFPDGLGPAHEIHAGSGYWSQDSSCLVLTQPVPAVELIIRWPGGKETRSRLPTDEKEVEVDPSGKLNTL